jgi:hypothetical protein
MARSFLLAPCLLICLACATPFRSAELEEGMTKDEVRALLGEPDYIWVPDIAMKSPRPGVVEEGWEYNHWFSATMALYFEDTKFTGRKVYYDPNSEGVSPSSRVRDASIDPFWAAHGHFFGPLGCC